MCSLTPGRAHAISVGLRSTHEVCRRRRCGGRVDACGERLPLILIPFTQQNPSHHAVLHKTKVRGPPLPVFTSPHLWSGGWQRGKSEGRRSKAERRPKPEPRSGSGFGLRTSGFGLQTYLTPLPKGEGELSAAGRQIEAARHLARRPTEHPLLGERAGVRGNGAAGLTLLPKTSLARVRPSLNS
jgi:hypothetical protein